MRTLTFPMGGIHPKEHKLTAGRPIEHLPEAPTELVLFLSQHIGAPSKPIVAKGDHVEAGQMIAEPGGFVSSALHSPVSGTVTRIDKAMTTRGTKADAIFIKADNEASAVPVRFDTEGLSIADAVKKAGIVGLGGATFPTQVKLTLPPGKKVDTVILNGAECEPWLTCDDALMRAEAAKIVEGGSLIKEAVGASRCIIGVEANKPQALEALVKAAAKVGDCEIVRLKTKYPQGGEKQLIKAVTKREVPSGGLPADVGVVVDNVATAYAVYEAVTEGTPLTGRVITVTGPELKRPGNYYAPLGTPIKALIEAAGGLPEDTGKVICGGPMMGQAAQTIDSYTTKGMGGLLVLPMAESMRKEPLPCIRCARCVDACPMGLEPYLLEALARMADFEEAKAQKVMNCIECGSCSWVCPSSRPLLDYIRVAKKRK